MSLTIRRLLTAAGIVLLPWLTSCVNPFGGCLAEYRFAEYKGRLGVQSPITDELSVRDSGRIYFSLDEFTGPNAQNQVAVSMNVWSFASSVSEVHVHRRTGSRAGQLLFSTTNGYLVRDSVWNGSPQIYTGPVSWSELWDALNDDNAYLELHPADGKPSVQGRLILSKSGGYQPACT
ncbi:MAG TPA: hypothetical protein VM939_04200 [Gemmatimonadaceae bacterium]|nr:hypothetical protein [Gemmatimonadaceae bacterium]